MKRLLTLLALALATATSFGATLNPIQLLNPAGSTAGQAIVSTGPSTAPAWAPVTATDLAAQAANTVVANVTAASASPTAVALPSCSTANSALKYTTSTGFSCGTTYALTSGTLAQFAATTSAQLLGVISDETGSGSLVFGTNPTISGATISGATSTGNLTFNYVGATNTRGLIWTNTGVNRWSLTNDGTTESGSNTGSNFALNSFNDAGTFINSPLVVNRATGLVTMALGAAISGGTINNSAIGGTTAASGKFTTLQSMSASHLLYTNGSAQSFTSGTAATVTTWTSVYDLNSNFNASTGTFTAPSAGYYKVSGQLVFSTGSAAAGTVFQALVLKNGSAIVSGWSTLAASTQGSIVVTFSVDLSLAASDTVTIQGKQNSGASLALAGGVSVNFLNITQIP